MDHSFRQKFISGVFYTSIAKYVGIILQMVISAILARLLFPEDFGIVAIATVIIGFVNLITDFGLAPAIVQSDELTQTDYRHLFSFTIYIGGVAAIVFFLLAGFISEFYSNENLKPIVQLLSLNVFFAALNIVPNALLLKAKQFKTIAIRSLLIQILGGIFAITLAFNGWGFYALVFNSIFSVCGVFVFNYCHYPLKISIKVSKSSINKVIHFSLVQFVSQIITYLNGTLDKLLVGKFINLSNLGYYEKSYRLMRMPVTNLTYVFTPVMQPLFKEFKNDLTEMEKKYRVLFKFISIVGLPLSVFLYYSASDLICIFFGEKWIPAVQPFQYFSLSAGLMMLLSSTGPIYQASHSLKAQIASCIGETIIGTSCLCIGLKLGGMNIVAQMVSLGILGRFIWSFSLIYRGIFKKSFFCVIKNAFVGIAVMLCSFLCMHLTSLFFNENLSFCRFSINTVLYATFVLFALQKCQLIHVEKFLKKITSHIK